MIESVVLLAILGGVGVWAYRDGKRRGSRRGFAAGRRRARTRRWRARR